MTILEASNKLFDFFKTHDTFSFPENFKDIVLITENKPKEFGVIYLALKKLEEVKLIKYHPVDLNEFWYLEKPLDSYEQSITVSPNTASTISKIVNKVYENNDEKYESDSLNINEKDINILLSLINSLNNIVQENKNE